PTASPRDGCPPSGRSSVTGRSATTAPATCTTTWRRRWPPPDESSPAWRQLPRRPPGRGHRLAPGRRPVISHRIGRRRLSRRDRRFAASAAAAGVGIAVLSGHGGAATPGGASSQAAARAIAYARQQLGKPYLWGGAG